METATLVMEVVMSDICYGFDGLPLVVGEMVWCIDRIYGYRDWLYIYEIEEGIGVNVMSPDGFVNVIVDPKTLYHKPFSS